MVVATHRGRTRLAVGGWRAWTVISSEGDEEPLPLVISEESVDGGRQKRPDEISSELVLRQPLSVHPLPRAKSSGCDAGIEAVADD